MPPELHSGSLVSCQNGALNRKCIEHVHCPAVLPGGIRHGIKLLNSRQRIRATGVSSSPTIRSAYHATLLMILRTLCCGAIKFSSPRALYASELKKARLFFVTFLCASSLWLSFVVLLHGFFKGYILDNCRSTIRMLKS